MRNIHSYASHSYPIQNHPYAYRRQYPSQYYNYPSVMNPEIHSGKIVAPITDEGSNKEDSISKAANDATNSIQSANGMQQAPYGYYLNPNYYPNMPGNYGPTKNITQFYPCYNVNLYRNENEQRNQKKKKRKNRKKSYSSSSSSSTSSSKSSARNSKKTKEDIATNSISYVRENSDSEATYKKNSKINYLNHL